MKNQLNLVMIQDWIPDRTALKVLGDTNPKITAKRVMAAVTKKITGS